MTDRNAPFLAHKKLKPLSKIHNDYKKTNHKANKITTKQY